MRTSANANLHGDGIFGGRMRRSSRGIWFTGLAVVVTALAWLTFAMPAFAANGTWSGTSAAIWDTTTTNWLNLTGTPWDSTNGGSNIAVFSTAGATPSVSGTVFVNGITFSQTGTVSNGTISLAGTTPTITASADAWIKSTLSGTGGLTKAGSGALTLAGASNFTGNVTMSSGTLLFGDGVTPVIANLGNSTFTLGGGSVVFNAGVSGTTSHWQMNSNTWLKVYGSLNAGEIWSNSGITTGSGGVVVGANGSLTARDFTSGWSLGSLQVDGTATFGSTGYASSLHFNNSMPFTGAGTVTFASQFNLYSNTTINSSVANLVFQDSFLLGAGSSGGTFNQTAGAVKLTTSTADKILIGSNSAGNGTLSIQGGVFTGTSSVTVVGYTGNGTVTVSGGTANFLGLDLSRSGSNANGTVTLSGGNLNVSGSGIYSSGGTGTKTINLNGGTLGALAAWSSTNSMTLGGTATVDTTGGNISLTGVLSGAGGLAKAGLGTLSLGGANTFSGAATISAGVLTFANANALQSTSGVNIADAAGLLYTGGAGTFARNITVTSGTGSVTNSGSGLLTLAGTLSKNGTVLRLTGGSFNVTGQIVGASANSDLLVDAATVTLSNTNSYNGPTFVQNAGTLVLGTSNAIPSNSAVSLAGSTLTVGGYTNAIGSLSTTGNSTINVSVSGGSSGGLSMGNLSFGGGTNTLALTMTSPTAGIYNLLSYSGSKTGSVTATGVDPNYTLLTGAASNGVIAVQRKAEFGTVTATPAFASIITGGSTSFGYTVANVTPSGGAALSFTSSNGSNVAGSSSGSAGAASTSTAIDGLFFTGTTVGLGQTGSFTLTDPNAITTTTGGTVTVDVLNHSLASFAAADVATKTLDFGTFDQGSSAWSGGDGGNGTLGYSLFNIAASGFTNAQTAGLALYDWTFTSGDNVFGLGLSTFANLGAGGSNPFSATVSSPGLLASGSYSGVYTLKFRDQSLPGALNTRDLTLTANVIVVPEPGTLALAGIGAAAAGWAASRRRRRAA